jgi:hypothetical protein
MSCAGSITVFTRYLCRSAARTRPCPDLEPRPSAHAGTTAATRSGTVNAELSSALHENSWGAVVADNRTARHRPSTAPRSRESHDQRSRSQSSRSGTEATQRALPDIEAAVAARSRPSRSRSRWRRSMSSENGLRAASLEKRRAAGPVSALVRPCAGRRGGQREVHPGDRPQHSIEPVPRQEPGGDEGQRDNAEETNVLGRHVKPGGRRARSSYSWRRRRSSAVGGRS